MFLNRYVLALAITLLISLFSFYLVLTKLNPISDTNVALPLFFVSIFFFVSSLLSLIGYSLRIALYQHELFLNHFNISLRQGIILGLCMSTLVGLQIMRTLSWWSGLLIIIISFFLEIYFVARD